MIATAQTTSLQEIYQEKLIIPLTELKKDIDLLKQIQIRLRDLGLYTYGANDPDGAWGPKTEQGIEKFCDAVHLNNFETGLFGPSFAKALIQTISVGPINPSDFGVPNWWQGGNKDALAKAVAKEGAKQGVVDRNQLCYIMATIQHETAHTYQPIAEYGGRSQKYTPYYGRGYVQLTHRYNYQAYKTKLGEDFVSYPNKVMEPANSLFIIIDSMKNGVFTGLKLGNFIAGNSVDFVRARKIVNGWDKADLIAGYARGWQNTKLF